MLCGYSLCENYVNVNKYTLHFGLGIYKDFKCNLFPSDQIMHLNYILMNLILIENCFSYAKPKVNTIHIYSF